MSYNKIRLDQIIDFNPRRNIKRETVTSFVEMAGIPEGNRDISYIFQKEFNGSGCKFRNGDTLFARITPCLENGKTAKVNCLKKNEVAHGSTEFIVFSAKEPAFDEDFIYYLCRWPKFREFAKSRMEGTSGRQRVDWKVLAESEWELPEKEERKEIGFLLKQFDDKISNNNRINRPLEEIAQALFKSWFVDFKPVKAKTQAKADGTNPQLAAMMAICGKTEEEILQLPEENQRELVKTADLFPDDFEESELGLIPVEWNIDSLNSISDHLKESVTPMKNGSKHFYHYSLPAFDNGKVPIIEYGTKIKSNKYKLVDRVILISKLNPNTPRIWDVPMLNGNNCVCSTEFQIVKPKKDIYFEFISQSLKSERVINEHAGKVTGTSKSHQRVRPSDIFETRIVIPDEGLIKVFSKLLANSYICINNNILQNNNLALTRDTLLPKLLSGELTINKI
jgi:type I restriction enzyme S subunit